MISHFNFYVAGSIFERDPNFIALVDISWFMAESIFVIEFVIELFWIISVIDQIIKSWYNIALRSDNMIFSLTKNNLKMFNQFGCSIQICFQLGQLFKTE